MLPTPGNLQRTKPNAISLRVQESDFFQQFDTDGDGFISFGEYLLIVTFLAIPLEVHSLGLCFSSQSGRTRSCCAEVALRCPYLEFGKPFYP